jgi:hypothetical protein
MKNLCYLVFIVCFITGCDPDESDNNTQEPTGTFFENYSGVVWEFNEYVEDPEFPQGLYITFYLQGWSVYSPLNAEPCDYYYWADITTQFEVNDWNLLRFRTQQDVTINFTVSEDQNTLRYTVDEDPSFIQTYSRKSIVNPCP